MADTFLFPQDPRGRSAQVSRNRNLLDATIRDFSGGWNVVDNDLNLDTKFSKVLENMQRGVDGSNAVRPGTRLFAETSAYLDEVVNIEYYSGFLVAVGKNGHVVKIDSNGIVSEIWNDEFGEVLPGAPGGWDVTVFASFAQFNGDLIICNGVNKPLIVDNNMICSYLQDLADLTNANTPVARFVVAHGRYLVMAGSLLAGEEDRLFISATDVSGTWVGDSGPNDAVNIDLGSRVPSGSNVVKGLGRFRDKLMVMFENSILPGTLGSFVDDVHIPTFSDAIENVGAVSHRAIQTISEDMLFGDGAGVSNVKRALITGTVTGERISQLVSPEYIAAVNTVGKESIVALEDRVWSIWDSQNDNFMIFVPNSHIAANATESRCFVLKKNKPLKIESWHDWRGWNFRSGCQSALKRIFLTEGSQVYILGAEYDNAIYKDYEGDQEMWDDETSWSDYTGWNPVVSTADSGVPIKFVWELPWSDNNERFLTKASRYINFDTIGDNRFTAEMFTDNIYKDTTDLGEDWIEDSLKWDDTLGWDVDVLDPTLSMTFEGGDAPGFGLDEFGEDFGGGRPTRLEKLYAWTARYKIEKLRMTGDATKELKFVAVTVAYQNGSLRR